MGAASPTRADQVFDMQIRQVMSPQAFILAQIVDVAFRLAAADTAARVLWQMPGRRAGGS
jgi:hypothetical protein